jgi:flavin prenyltransferase
MSPWAAATIQAETSFTVKDVERLANYTYSPKNLPERQEAAI